MAVLLALLAAVSLLGLRPWGVDTAEPRLSIPLDFGVAVEEAVALPDAPEIALADARLVPAAAPVLVVEDAVPQPPVESEPLAAIGPARVVAASRAAPVDPPAPAPVAPAPAPAPPVALPVAAAPPAPVATPLPVPLPEPPAGPTTLLVSEGDEYELTFSLAVEAPLPGELPAEELIVQFTSEASELPGLGLHLRDDGSGAGHALWASGELAGGERLLAPLSVGATHEATVYFRASGEGDGFYMVLLDGALIDANFGVDLIEEGSSSAAVELTPGASIADLSG